MEGKGIVIKKASGKIRGEKVPFLENYENYEK